MLRRTLKTPIFSASGRLLMRSLSNFFFNESTEIVPLPEKYSGSVSDFLLRRLVLWDLAGEG